MKIDYLTSLRVCLILAVGASWAQPYAEVIPIPLTDYRAYRLNSPELIEPSGLTLKDGRLYTVGDKHNAIYEITFHDEEAHLELAIRLNSERDLDVSVLDLEGITVMDDDFVLVSEAHHRLILLDSDHTMYWLPADNALYASAYQAGLLQLHNAGLEGLAYLGNNQFLIAAERQPRGLIEVTFDKSLSKIKTQTNQLLPFSRQKLHNRHPDLTGLFVLNEQVFGLQRNAYVVHELNRGGDGRYYEGQAWSYEAIVRHPDYAYASMRFGHAEGLAVDGDYFYMVFDNNQIGHAKKPNDKRPLLIIAKRP